MDTHGRYQILDQIRGLALLSMFLYHGVWDLVYLFGWDLPWYHGPAAYVWQQSICWTFILLSGFCFPFGKRKLRRAACVFGAGVLVSAVTLVFLPEDPVLFGVLTLTGTCMFLWIGLEKVFSGLFPAVGLVGSALLFLLTRNVNEGWLGFEGLRLVRLPESWYADLFSAWLGFPAADFFSVDYFSLIPWLFLFSAGCFLNRLVFRTGARVCTAQVTGTDAQVCTAQVTGTGAQVCTAQVTGTGAQVCTAQVTGTGAQEERPVSGGRLPEGFGAKSGWSVPKGLAWLGRHSLLLYLLHQPVTYGLLWAADRLC